MSGHSHWATIKHKKAATDAKKGKVFSKIAKALMIAARQGGADPNMNLKLKYAMDAAREVSMPRDSVDRAVKKGAGKLEGAELVESLYEGYGPGGVALMIEVLSDNKNRTVSELRKIFERRGGNIGANGCVAWMFGKKGVVRIPVAGQTEDALTELALDAGADNIEKEDDAFVVTTKPEDLIKIREFFEKKGVKVESAKTHQVPSTIITCDGSTGRRVLELLDEIESHDDVQNVYANCDIPDDVIKQMESSS
jgi:YebC/PmpR family DNA-binding regulatory protein